MPHALRRTPTPHGVGRGLIGASLAAALVAAAGMPAEAASQSQSFSTTYQQSSFGLGLISLYPPAPQFSVQPFDSSLGTLTSATIRWATAANASVTVAPGTGGGSWALEFGGALTVNGFPYNGYGGGKGAGAGPGERIDLQMDPVGRSDTFTAAEATVWEAITGTAPYAIAFGGSYSGSTPYRITAINTIGGEARVISQADVTYTYTPNPAPTAPAPLPLLGAMACWRTSRRLRRSLTARDGQPRAGVERAAEP